MNMKVGLKLVWLLVVTSLVSLSSFGFTRGADLEYVIIREGEPGRSVMYASITGLKDGTLLCAYWDNEIDVNGEYGDKVKGSPWSIPGTKVMCVRSDDKGRTWSESPVLIYQDKDNFSSPSTGGPGYQAKDGTIFLSIVSKNLHLEGTESLCQQWNLMAQSKDNGYTWNCERLSSEPFYSMGHYGNFTRLNDGALWLARRCHGYKVGYEEVKKGHKDRGCYRILESTDDGKTWSHYSYIGYDPTRPEETAHFPSFEEPAIVQLPSGKILMITRPYMHKGISLDRGRTWQIVPSTLTRDPKQKESEPGHTGYSGLCPIMCYTKAGPPTGTIVLVYHDRWGEHAQRGGVYVRFSHDEGESWGYPTFVDRGAYPVLHELEQDSGKFLCGYYRHNSLLKGVFFSLPFPTGIHSEPSTKDSSLPCITIQWDAYKGKASKDYEYRIYRSTTEAASLEQSKLLFSSKNISSYDDQTVEPNKTYYYRVAACIDGKITNQSWQTSATATSFVNF